MKKLSHVVVLLTSLGFASVVGLILLSNDNLGYFLDPSTVNGNVRGEYAAGDTVRVGGAIEAVTNNDSTGTIQVSIKDRFLCDEALGIACNIAVTTPGPLPAYVEAPGNVIVEGIYDGAKIEAVAFEQKKVLSYGEHAYFVWSSFFSTYLVICILLITSMLRARKAYQSVRIARQLDEAT